MFSIKGKKEHLKHTLASLKHNNLSPFLKTNLHKKVISAVKKKGPKGHI